jgi:hypothetical protein
MFSGVKKPQARRFRGAGALLQVLRYLTSAGSSHLDHFLSSVKMVKGKGFSFSEVLRFWRSDKVLHLYFRLQLCTTWKIEAGLLHTERIWKHLVLPSLQPGIRRLCLQHM